MAGKAIDIKETRDKEGHWIARFNYLDRSKINPKTGKPGIFFSCNYVTETKGSRKTAEKEFQTAFDIWKARIKNGEVLTKSQEKERQKQEFHQAELKKQEYQESPSFSEYRDRYLKERKCDIKTGTANTIKQVTNRFITYTADPKIIDITQSQMMDYKNYLFNESGLKYSSCSTHFEVLQRIFNVAVESKVITESPMKGIRKPKNRQLSDENMDNKILTPDQITYFLQCAEKESSKWKTILIFALDSGCRRGEIAGLKWSNVDLETGKVRICNNVQSDKEKGVYETTPKNNQAREFYLSDFALNVMKEWHEIQKMENVYFGGRYESTYCFEGLNGGVINPGTISNHFKAFGRKYGLEDFHTHMLRHTNCSISLANGEDLLAVSKKLGHASPAFTMKVYGHTYDEKQRTLSNNFERIVYRHRLETETVE